MPDATYLEEAKRLLAGVKRRCLAGGASSQAFEIAGYAQLGEEWLRELPDRSTQDNLLRVPRESLKLLQPGTRLDDRGGDYFLWNETLENQDVYALQSQGLRFTSWGHAWSGRDKRLIRELSTFAHRSAADPSFIKLTCHSRHNYRFLEGRSLFMNASNGGRNYFHWLLDELPREYILQSLGITPASYDHVVLNQPGSALEQRLIKRWGLSHGQLVYACENPALMAESGTVTTSPLFGLGIPTAWAIRWLRSTFLPQNTQETDKQAGARLFIHREGERRKLSNQDELEVLLQREGFTIIRPDEMSWEAQIRNFQTASVIVAVHGAALANLSFCQPGTQVLELHPPAVRMGCYQWICHWNKLRYYYAEIDGEPGNKEGAIHCHPRLLERFLQHLD